MDIAFLDYPSNQSLDGEFITTEDTQARVAPFDPVACDTVSIRKFFRVRTVSNISADGTLGQHAGLDSNPGSRTPLFSCREEALQEAHRSVLTRLRSSSTTLTLILWSPRQPRITTSVPGRLAPTALTISKAEVIF